MNFIFRCCLVILLVSLACTTAWASELTHRWSYRFGDGNFQFGRGVAVDGEGNVLATGSFSGSVDFGGGPLTSAGASDIYLAKFDSEGNHLWSQRFGDSDIQIPLGVATDGAGSVFITGMFYGTVDFGGGPLIGAGGRDIFLAKFDPSGNHLWSHGFGDEDSQESTGLALDGGGNVFITGWFDGTVDFGGGPLDVNGDLDVFLARFDPNGNHLWSQRFGGVTRQEAYDVAADGEGNVVITGHFDGTVDFGGGPLMSEGAEDIFLAMHDADGLHRWSRSFGDSESQSGESVAVDGAGDVLLTGDFRGIVDCGGGPLTSAGETDILLAKFDQEGDHLWSHGFGDPEYQGGRSVAADGAGNVLLTGYMSGTVDFGGGPLVSEGSDVFLAWFDTDGSHLWSERFGDSEQQLALSVAADGSGSVLLTGFFLGTLDFGGGPLVSDGGYDIFLVSFVSDEPTPVLLTHVFVGEVDLGVELKWAVLSDVSVAGFEVYRASSPDAVEARLLATFDGGNLEQIYRDDTVAPGESYYYWIGVLDIAGGRERFGPFNITFVGSEDHLLLSSHPNPFVDQTTIRFYVPKPSDAALRIYAPTGQIVRFLRAPDLGAGIHSLVWDRRDQAGRLVASGTYFCSIDVDGKGLVGEKLIVLR
jgi:hypothetical protein